MLGQTSLRLCQSRLTTSSQNYSSASRHVKLLIVGGGCGGSGTAHRFAKRISPENIAVIEPAQTHYYQPYFTLVGSGIGQVSDAARPMASVLPKGISWIQQKAAKFDPDNNAVYVEDGSKISYDYLVLAMGLQLKFEMVKGLPEALAKDPSVCSNYSPDTVIKTFEAFKKFKGGNALFTFPNTPVKCAGAPQKIMYMFDDYMRKNNKRSAAEVHYYTSLAAIFGIKHYATPLAAICQKRNLNIHTRQNLVEVRHVTKEAVMENLDTKENTVVKYDFLHATPPMGPFQVLKESPFVDPTTGFVQVDKHTLQSPKYSNVFALGDCASLPAAKTAAGVSSQLGVVSHNLWNVMQKDTSTPPKHYTGYASCPLVTSYSTCILAEFDYSGEACETFPVDQRKERYSAYLMKLKAFPFMYWKFLLTGWWNGPSTVRKILHLGRVKS